MGAISERFRRRASRKNETMKGAKPAAADDSSGGGRSTPWSQGGRTPRSAAARSIVDDDASTSDEKGPPLGSEEKEELDDQDDETLVDPEQNLPPLAQLVYERAVGRAACGDLEGAVADYAADVALLAGRAPGSAHVERLLRAGADTGASGDVETFRLCLLELLREIRFPEE